jgi:hypothetical protein
MSTLETNATGTEKAALAVPSDLTKSQWTGESHPFAGLKTTGLRTAGAEPGSLTIPDNIYAADSPPAKIDTAPPRPDKTSTKIDIPAPIKSAMDQGKSVQFVTAGDDKAQPANYILTPSGEFKATDAKPSDDGSVRVQIQGIKDLNDATIHETDMQKQAAKELIQYFQKSNPGKQVPDWMQALANAKPNLLDVPPDPSHTASDSSASGSGGFTGHGAFDEHGYFDRNHAGGGGSVWTGGRDDHFAPVGPGEQAKAEDIYDYLTQHGFNAAQASGILGNMQTESSFCTGANNKAEGAIGLCQWEGARRGALEEFARQEGKPVTDLHVQLDFMIYEFAHKESGAYAALMRAQTPERAAEIFQSQYERSQCLGNRAANAGHLYGMLAQRETDPPTS